MAKQKTQTQKTAQVNRMFANAADETTGAPIFANQVQIITGPEEVTIDFYRAGPGRGEVSKMHVAFVQRIIMPPEAALKFSEAFAGLLKAKPSEETLDQTPDQIE